MQRLIEQAVGDGELFEENGHVGRVHYHLDVYRHYSDAGEPVPANFEVCRVLPWHGAIFPAAAEQAVVFSANPDQPSGPRSPV